MGLRALKATPRYAAFRRWRTRARERLRRLWRGLDAWTGGRRLRRESLQALVEGQALQLRATAELTERVRALEAALARLEAGATPGFPFTPPLPPRPPVNSPPSGPAAHGAHLASQRPIATSGGDGAPMPTWNLSIAVGHPLIDEQHQELFRRADELIEAMMAGRAAGEMQQLLVFLRDYCRDHFGMEERLMVARCYPAVEQHKLAHREFERRFQEIEKDMAAKGPSSTVVLATKDLIRGWLVNHIGSIDAKLAAFLKARTTA